METACTVVSRDDGVGSCSESKSTPRKPLYTQLRLNYGGERSGVQCAHEHFACRRWLAPPLAPARRRWPAPPLAPSRRRWPLRRASSPEVACTASRDCPPEVAATPRLLAGGGLHRARACPSEVAAALRPLAHALATTPQPAVLLSPAGGLNRARGREDERAHRKIRLGASRV